MVNIFFKIRHQKVYLGPIQKSKKFRVKLRFGSWSVLIGRQRFLVANQMPENWKFSL